MTMMTRAGWLLALACLMGCDDGAQATPEVADAFAAAPADADAPDAAGCTPVAEVSPLAVQFGRVAVGDVAEAQVMVRNGGACPLEIDLVTLGGSADFAVLVDGVDPRRDPAPLADPDGDGEAGLAPGAGLTLTVRYQPATPGADQGELLLRTGAGEQRVTLSGNEGGACLAVRPEAVQFDPVALGQADDRQVTLEACGDAPVEVRAVALAEGTDAAFTLRDATPLTLAPGETSTFTVRFEPVEARPHQGTLVLETTDPARPTLRLGLLGLGAADGCPRAHALPVPERLSVGDVITLDASPSVDPDGPDRRPVQFHWAVIEAPDGSTAAPLEAFLDEADPAGGGRPDEIDTPQAVFSPAVPGRYALRLDVVDVHGLASSECDATATVAFVVDPPDALRVRLTWRTPGDPTPDDGVGTDLDLYLLHPLAQGPDSDPLVCSSRNPSPDWGPQGPEGDPVLDLDDVNGDGPETIVVTTPEATDDGYVVGVRYVADAPMFGGVVAVVQVYGGDGLLAVVEAELAAPGDWWTPFSVQWPTGVVVPIE